MINHSVHFGYITMSITKHLKTFFLAITLFLFSQHSFAEFIELTSFGENPGDLKASYYLPKMDDSNNASPALVVLLHGCAQQAEALAQQSGLAGLAKQHNFALLLTQQGLTNNIKHCFNWYSADDYTKDKGETLSIKNMITTLKQKLASENVYIIGLSAGGAMASSLLVNYPELFTAGAVVAGIPFPCADGLITGISCMKNGPSQTTDELVTLIQKMNPKQTTWPKLSVWTGANDSIVNPLNSSMLAQQWAQLLKVTAKPIVDKKSGYTITRWQNVDKKTQVELVEVMNRDHGIMVNPNEENGGEVSDYLLASPISTVKHVMKLWQLQ
tara:strand:- start:3536 stop:4519 length:984 start_codon:yes stop_codon:yes gene_type:complete